MHPHGAYAQTRKRNRTDLRSLVVERLFLGAGRFAVLPVGKAEPGAQASMHGGGTHHGGTHGSTRGGTHGGTGPGGGADSGCLGLMTDFNMASELTSREPCSLCVCVCVCGVGVPRVPIVCGALDVVFN